MKFFGFTVVLLTVLSCVASQDIYGNYAGSYDDSLEGNLEERNEGLDIMLVQYADYMNHAKATETNVSCEVKGDYYCSSCITPAYCDDNGIQMTYPDCSGGESCILDYGVSLCSKDTSDKCTCGAGVKACDSYEPNNVLFCDGNGPFWSDPCGDDETCSEGECVEAPTTASTSPTTATTPKPTGCNANITEDGLNYLDDSCQEVIYCNGDTLLSNTTCKDGEYYDPDLGCQAAPPKPCGDNCIGYCPDPVDCTKYHVCDGEGNSKSTVQCGEGEQFNSESTPPKCDSTGNVNCPKLSECTELMNTTPTPTTPTPTTPTPTTPTPTTPTPTTPTPTTPTPTTPTPTTPTPTPTTPTPTTPTPTTPTPTTPTPTTPTPTTPTPTTPTPTTPTPTTPTPTPTPTTPTPTTPTPTTPTPTTPTPTTPTPTTTESNAITTPVPSTCNENTLGTMYPHVDNCKMYYICAKTSAGDYEYEERSCVSVLVFNPVILRCDVPANVPDCEVKLQS